MQTFLHFPPSYLEAIIQEKTNTFLKVSLFSRAQKVYIAMIFNCSLLFDFLGNDIDCLSAIIIRDSADGEITLWKFSQDYEGEPR